MTAVEVLKIVTLFGPLIQAAIDYVDGKRDDLPPEMPESLKSPLRLERMKRRGPTKG